MSTQPVALRLALPIDVPVLVRLEAQWEAEESVIGQTGATSEQVGGWLGPWCLVAEQAGAIIGFVAASIQVSEGLAVIPAGERYLQVDELYVLPAYRDAGVGSQLLERVLADAEAHGVSRSRVLTAARDWQRILRFYQRQGFTMWYMELCR